VQTSSCSRSTSPGIGRLGIASRRPTHKGPSRPALRPVETSWTW
jgi:hypothetical protein